MLQLMRPALASVFLFTAVLGLGYPLAVTGLAQLLFPAQAQGSLVRAGPDGPVVGSRLLGQAFTRPEYLHPRPSAAGAEGYDASASSGSNLGPLNPALFERIAKSAEALRADAGGAAIPADAVTTSASGLDPDISPAYAALQAPRIAAARSAPVEEVRRLLDSAVQRPALGVLGQPRVNVLQTNLALDARWPRRQPPAS